MSLNPNARRAQRRKAYHMLRSRGICVRCRKAPASPGRACCPACLKTQSLHTRKREIRIYPHLKALGICVACKQAHAMAGRTKCGKCSEEQYERTARMRRRMAGVGKCIDCGGATESGLRCERCRGILRARYNERVTRCAHSASARTTM